MINTVLDFYQKRQSNATSKSLRYFKTVFINHSLSQQPYSTSYKSSLVKQHSVVDVVYDALEVLPRPSDVTGFYWHNVWTSWLPSHYDWFNFLLYVILKLNKPFVFLIILYRYISTQNIHYAYWGRCFWEITWNTYD